MILKELIKDIEPFDELIVDNDLRYIVSAVEVDCVIVRSYTTGNLGKFSVNSKIKMELVKCSKLYD